MGRTPIPILLKATSPEGETRTFTSIGEAAKELGFSEREVGRAFHKKRNRIGDYELEWLEPEPESEPAANPEAVARIGRMKKMFTHPICSYCNKPLTREDRVEDGFDISRLDEKIGYLMEDYYVKSLYNTHKLTGLSLCSLINAVDKGNVMITRRKDKQRFMLGWQSIHDRCFELRKEERRLEVRKRIKEEVERKKEEERLEKS